MFTATGGGLGALRVWQNDGKRPRHSLDQWDRVSLLPVSIGNLH